MSLRKLTLWGALALGIAAVLLRVVGALPLPADTERWQPTPPVVTPPSNARISAAPPGAVVLFDGRDLNEWLSADGESAAGWKIEKGALLVDKSTGDIRTRRLFRDYQLHIEWRIPEHISGEGQSRGNSGLFMAWNPERGRGYELQILDSYQNKTYVNGMAGSVYKQLVPLVNASLKPGQWQAYDVVWTAPEFGSEGDLVAPARLTVYYNGVLIQDDVALLGETRFIGRPAYYAHESLPILLQAHRDPSPPISFRNIWLRELGKGPNSETD